MQKLIKVNKDFLDNMVVFEYKDLNLTRKKAIIEMRRGGRIGKVDLTKSKGNSSENDAASEHKKPSEEEIKIRPPPDVRVKSIITYQLCKHVTRYGRCNRGDECVFAHSKEELKVWEEVLAEKRSKIDVDAYCTAFFKSVVPFPPSAR